MVCSCPLLNTSVYVFILLNTKKYNNSGVRQRLPFSFTSSWKVSQHYLNVSCRENTKFEPFWSSHFTHPAALQLFLPAMQSTCDTQLLLHRVVSIVKGEPMWCTHAVGLQTSPPHGEPTFILAWWLTELHESYCFYTNTDAVLAVVNESTRIQQQAKKHTGL